MECFKVEQWLSEYMESNLPANEMEQAKEHLESCRNCSALFREMQSVVSLCRSYPAMEIDLRIIERILLRTSGRPRTRSYKELFHQYFIRPLLTPKLAVGATLAALFLVLVFDLMMPKLSVTISSLSPLELMRLSDRGAQRLYGEGLKAYNMMNGWQAKFDRFKNNTWNGMRSVMDQIEVPVEGRKKTEEAAPRKGQAPKEKSSELFLLSA
jgi:hypothetical protein